MLGTTLVNFPDVKSRNSSQRFPVSVVQARPHLLDLASTLKKTLQLIEQAARRGSKLVCFGETWLPGYPAWLDFCNEVAIWNHAPVKQVYAQLRANSVAVPGKEVAAISKAAAKLKIAVCVGINERVEQGPARGTLFNSLLLFAENGNLVTHHRKLMPTYSEKMLWGLGDDRGLQSALVNGVHTGGLICWEHWMPLARQAMHNSGEQIHIAAWPTVHEMHQIASRHYAFEGRCFVLAVGQILQADDLPKNLHKMNGLKPEMLVERGGSAIIAPDGRYVADPVFDKETIISAELDLTEIDKEVMTLDVSGHYSRPDIFNFSLNR